MEMFLIRGREGAIFARERARETARRLGFSLVDQTKIAFAVSELVLKHLHMPEPCKISIQSVGENERVSGIEIRLYGNRLHEELLNRPWTFALADDFDISDLTGDSSRQVTFRKWRPAPAPEAVAVCAAYADAFMEDC